MNICPNCRENHNDKNFDNYCDDCYQEIYLDFNEDPNTDKDVMIIKPTHYEESI